MSAEPTPERPHMPGVRGLWDGTSFWFSTGRHSRKARNIDAGSSVRVTAGSGDIAVSVDGEADDVRDPGPLEWMAREYSAKCDWKMSVQFLLDNAVYAVRARAGISFREDLGDTATRWRFA